jgi:hypothetical protein
VSARPPLPAVPPGAAAGGPSIGGRRRGATRSTNEHSSTVYYCTGGAGKARAEAEAAATGLTWLTGGGHVPVTRMERPGHALLRCPLCGLTRPVGYKTRKRIRAAGLREVDISRPPF